MPQGLELASALASAAELSWEQATPHNQRMQVPLLHVLPPQVGPQRELQLQQCRRLTVQCPSDLCWHVSKLPPGLPTLPQCATAVLSSPMLRTRRLSLCM